MYWEDHPPPHFHAKYADYEIEVEILTGAVQGRFPRRALQHVLEWHALHGDELLENWELCRHHRPTKPIPPLE